MAGGGQAGELKEDKLDKGMQVFRLERQSGMLTCGVAVDLFQQHILKQDGQVSSGGNLPSHIAELNMAYRATSLQLSNLKTNKSPTRSGFHSSLSLATNCRRTSSLRRDW